MNDQKNLFLAIGISIVIIVIFQILFPQQTMINEPIKQAEEEIRPATSIDDNQNFTNNEIKSKETIHSCLPTWGSLT